MTLRAYIAMVVPVLLVFSGCEKSTVEGTGGKELTLTKPSSVSVQRGETDKVNISISRKNFTGPVRIKFNNLPAGMEVVDANREIGGDDATFVLQASDKADLVENHNATVTVEGPEGMRATQPLVITVKEK
jgi:hypothetical protein